MPTVPSSCPLWLLTPGVRVASWVKLRPFSCSCEISLPVITPDISEDCVSTAPTPDPSTVTSEVEPPTWSVASTRVFCATLRTTPLAWYFLKPGASTWRSYVPPGRPPTTYSPSLLVLVMRLAPPSELLTVICALAIFAPLGSRTVPVICPVSWVNAEDATTRPNQRTPRYFICCPRSLDTSQVATLSAKWRQTAP